MRRIAVFPAGRRDRESAIVFHSIAARPKALTGPGERFLNASLAQITPDQQEAVQVSGRAAPGGPLLEDAGLRLRMASISKAPAGIGGGLFSACGAGVTIYRDHPRIPGPLFGQAGHALGFSGGAWANRQTGTCWAYLLNGSADLTDGRDEEAFYDADEAAIMAAL